jgi:septal ring factor EnvC (AmiA/AmiB activator)
MKALHRKGLPLALVFLVATAVLAFAILLLAARHDEEAREMADRLREPETLTPTLRLPNPAVLAALPGARVLNHPLNYPNGVLTYNAQRFGENQHLGDDFNGIGGMDSDLGDPVHAIAPGWVALAEDIPGGWGKVVVVVHALEQPGRPRRYLQSMSAHLREMRVEPGQHVAAGEVIGTIGSADGAYPAHLHFEMREFTNPFIGPGYRPLPAPGWLDPAETLETHQPEDETLRFLPALTQ